MFKKIIKNSLVTVLYHQVSDSPSEFHEKNDLNVRLNNFYNQLLFFKKNFNIISARQLITKNFETPALLITFDDGEKSYFSNAVEILNDLNLPSLHFLNMEPINGGINFNGLIGYLTQKNKQFIEINNSRNLSKKNFKKKEIFDYLYKNNKNLILKNAKKFHGSWASINDLENVNNNKLISFGNHLYNHYNVMNLNNDEIKFQFNENSKNLKKFDNYINIFSYPYGQPNLHYNNDSNKLIKDLGAKLIFSANPINYNYENNEILHRLPMHDFVNNNKKIIEHILRPKIRSGIKNFFGIY